AGDGRGWASRPAEPSPAAGVGRVGLRGSVTLRRIWSFSSRTLANSLSILTRAFLSSVLLRVVACSWMALVRLPRGRLTLLTALFGVFRSDWPDGLTPL